VLILYFEVNHDENVLDYPEIKARAHNLLLSF